MLGGLRRERSEKISVGAVGITMLWTLGVTVVVAFTVPFIVEEGRLEIDDLRYPMKILLLLLDLRRPRLEDGRAGILLLLSDLVILL